MERMSISSALKYFSVGRPHHVPSDHFVFLDVHQRYNMFIPKPSTTAFSGTSAWLLDEWSSRVWFPWSPEMELLRVVGIAPLLGTPKDKFEEIVQLVITWNVWVFLPLSNTFLSDVLTMYLLTILFSLVFTNDTTCSSQNHQHPPSAVHQHDC